jgi:hypothetical protein
MYVNGVKSGLNRWPDEFVKNRPRCGPTHVCQNLYIKFTVKKVAQTVGLILEFFITCHKKTSADWAKIRPIWSPW